MITKSQIQIVQDLIKKRYNALSRGNVIVIRSSDFDNVGVRGADNQIEILKFLAFKKKNISFTVSKSDREEASDPEFIRQFEEATFETARSFDEELKYFLNILTYEIVVLNKPLVNGLPSIQNTPQIHGTDDKYKLTYSLHMLKLNDVLIANPDALRENDDFLTYIFSDGGANKVVRVEELLKYMGKDKLTKTIHQILSGLNIKGDFRKMFFPNVSSKGFDFINPITYSYFEENYQQELNLDELKLKKNSDK